MPLPDDLLPGPDGAKRLGSLALPDAWVSWAWELTRRRIESAPELVTAKVRVESFAGVQSLRSLASLRPPSLRLYPGLQGSGWSDEGRAVSVLAVGLEAVLADLNPFDVINLQEALVRRLLGTDDGGADFRRQLIEDANATTGQWRINRALSEPQQRAGSDKLFRLTGLMTLDVYSTLYPLV